MKLVSESEDYCLRCTAVSVSQGKHPRPQPMNTVQMLKVASKALGESKLSLFML
jgi:hypothetical protein